LIHRCVRFSGTISLAGAKHVADMLYVNGALTNLDVSENALNDKDMAMLRYANKRREGCTLQMGIGFAHK
jgi:hypothetical protein